MANNNNTNSSTSSSVQVFVRIRPLTPTEANEKHESLCYKTIDATKIVLPSTKKVFGPFTQIFQEDHNNQHVFQQTIEHSVSNILNGETICCFCHGHTGSGKTHTIMGYGSEYGLYDLSSINLWKLIDSYNSSETNESKKLKLQIRFAEQYNDKIYDLLNNREECFVREDSHGTVHIRSATVVDENGRVKVGGLKQEFALNHEDVIKIVKKGIDNRTTGSSSIHDQSSRSHSVLEFQIVNQNVQEITSLLLEAQATLVPIGKKKDDTAILIQMKSYKKDEHDNWVKIPNAVSPEERQLLEDLEDQFTEAESVIANLKLKLQDEMKSYSDITLGGMFVFIDLAGAEYVTDPSMASPKTRTAKELKEGQYINGSLLALKECIRSIHNKKQHVPFRNSKLTQILRDYLLAKNAKTLMIGTMSSSKLHEAHAKNTLHYAELAAKVDC